MPTIQMRNSADKYVGLGGYFCSFMAGTLPLCFGWCMMVNSLGGLRSAVVVVGANPMFLLVVTFFLGLWLLMAM